MKHNIISFAVILVILFAELSAHHPKCPGVEVNGKFHRKEIITNGINRPYQLSLYHPEHTLYFSYNTGDDDNDQFEIGYLKKGDKLPTPIPAVKNGFATALDEDHKLLYLGGSEGIFVLNLTKSDDIEHVVKGHDIWDMFYKDHLYFIAYPSQRLYRKTHNSSELVESITESVYQFAIDGDNNTYITTKGGLHVIKSGTNERIPYEGPTQFRAIEIDGKGIAHFCANSSIYIDKGNHTLKEIVHVKNVFGLAFDGNNNIIYSDPHEIVKLLPHKCK